MSGILDTFGIVVNLFMEQPALILVSLVIILFFVAISIGMNSTTKSTTKPHPDDKYTSHKHH